MRDRRAVPELLSLCLQREELLGGGQWRAGMNGCRGFGCGIGGGRYMKVGRHGYGCLLSAVWRRPF